VSRGHRAGNRQGGLFRAFRANYSGTTAGRLIGNKLHARQVLTFDFVQLRNYSTCARLTFPAEPIDWTIESAAVVWKNDEFGRFSRLEQPSYSLDGIQWPRADANTFGQSDNQLLSERGPVVSHPMLLGEVYLKGWMADDLRLCETDLDQRLQPPQSTGGSTGPIWIQQTRVADPERASENLGLPRSARARGTRI